MAKGTIAKQPRAPFASSVRQCKKELSYRPSGRIGSAIMSKHRPSQDFVDKKERFVGVWAHYRGTFVTFVRQGRHAA